MSTVEIKDPVIDMKMETEEDLEANNRAVRHLVDALKEWGALCEVAEITLTRDPGNPLLYAYKVERKDSRELLETWLLSNDKDRDPLITVVLDPAWKVSALEAGEVITHRLAGIRATWGIVSFEAEFA